MQLLLLLHCVSKNVRPFTCYNLDIHDNFGRSVRESDNALFSHLIYLVLLHYFAE